MPDQKTIVCFGAGPMFKGGMSNYNTSLSKALLAAGAKVHIISWIQQYPGVVPREFRDKVSKQDFLEGTDIACHYLTNYNRPGTWSQTASFIAALKPDIVVIQWSIALQGLPLSFIIKKLKTLCTCEVIMDLHFVVQKEQSFIDKFLSKKTLSLADSFIVHAMKTFEELKELLPAKEFILTYNGQRDISQKAKPVIKLFHPIYDLYKEDPGFDVEAFKAKNGLKKNVFLFFGFIRKYKGLHNAILAFNELTKTRNDVSLLICGESFWNTLDPGKPWTKIKKTIFNVLKNFLLRSKEDEGDYAPLTLINELGLGDRVVVFNEFIPNEDVHKYFQVSDCVVLYYLTATPSGIESLSYNFDLPILATRVGHFPETIVDGYNGYMAEENIASMAMTMKRFLEHPIPKSNVHSYKDKLSWAEYAQAILK